MQQVEFSDTRWVVPSRPPGRWPGNGIKTTSSLESTAVDHWHFSKEIWAEVGGLFGCWVRKVIGQQDQHGVASYTKTSQASL